MIIDAETLTQLDTTLRLLAIGGQIMMIAVALFSKIRSDIKIPLLGLLIGAIAYLVNSSAVLSPPGQWRIPIDFLSISTTVWAWIFAHQLFERPIKRSMLIAAPLILGIFWTMGRTVPGVEWFIYDATRLVSLALVLHMIAIGVSGRADDLIEKRRRIRTFLPILVGLQIGGVLTYELSYGGDAYLPIVSALNAFFILLLVLGAGVAVLAGDQEIFSHPKPQYRSKSGSLNLSPTEAVLHDKLIAIMNEGHYRTPALTIAALADQLSTPEHRLRALINKQLGHRNFSSFLNGYRIKEAKEKLADRELVDLPILTIAMDLGYNSLAPFNRAFRSETGQTPSDFRKSVIDQN